MFILNYPAFIRTAAAVSNKIDQLNEWFSKQQGSIDSQLNNIHKNTRDNLSRNRRRLEELQRQQDEVGSKTPRDERVNKLENMDKSLKIDYKAQLAKQYEKLLNRVETNQMMVERVSPKDQAEASRKKEMLDFFSSMASKLEEGIKRIHDNVNLENVFPMITRKKNFLPENLPDTPPVEHYLDIPRDNSKDQDLKRFTDPNKEWLTSKEQEARELLDTAEADVESYVTTYNEIKQEAQKHGFLMGYIERSIKTQNEGGSSLIDESGAFSSGAALMQGLKITPNLLDSFGTVWYNTAQAIESDDEDTWDAQFIFEAEIPYDSIDWKEMNNQYVQTTEAIPGEIYVKKGAPVKIVSMEQVNADVDKSYTLPAERRFMVKARFETNYSIRIAVDGNEKLPDDYQEKINIYKSQYDQHKKYDTLHRFYDIIRDLEYLSEGDADQWYSLKKFFDKEKGWTPEMVTRLLNELQASLHYKDHFPHSYPENEMELNSKYSNKIISKNTDFEKIAFDLFASLPLKNLKKVAAVYNEINRISSSQIASEDEKLQYLISSFFTTLDEIAPSGTKFSMREDGALGFWGVQASPASNVKTSALPLEDEDNLQYNEGVYHEPYIPEEDDRDFRIMKDSPKDSAGVSLSPEELEAIDKDESLSPEEKEALKQEMLFNKEQDFQESDKGLEDKSLENMGHKVDYSDKFVDNSLEPEIENQVDDLETGNEYGEYLNSLKTNYEKGSPQTVTPPKNMSEEERIKRHEAIGDLTRRYKLQKETRRLQQQQPDLAKELSTNRW